MSSKICREKSWTAISLNEIDDSYSNRRSSKTSMDHLLDGKGLVLGKVTVDCT